MTMVVIAEFLKIEDPPSLQTEQAEFLMPLGTMVQFWGANAILKCNFKRGKNGQPDVYSVAVVKIERVAA